MEADSPTKIAFITDVHIDLPEVFPSDRDTRKQFLRILDHIKNDPWDAIILGGDLCNKEGNANIYAWIKLQLSNLDLIAWPISGNHDDSPILAQGFHLEHKLTNGALYYTLDIKDHHFIMLDTSRGIMDEQQWQWFDNEISASVKKQIFICMHHPPIIAGSKHMEPKYMFKEMERFRLICQQYPDKKFHIFTGHYHIDRTIVAENMIIYISPSTFLQIDPESISFNTLNDSYGYRTIRITPRDEVLTYPVYI
ncbi:MAG: metallophosphoesterase [Chitinophagales bacterium]|nr:metallophosphoesterase [Chitinophagales bacterium]